MIKKDYIEKISTLDKRDQLARDKYLRDLKMGKIQGPLTGDPFIDKPWLPFYDEDKLTFDIPNQSVYDYVYEHNQDNLDNTALEFFGTKITYRKFFEKVDETVKSFLKMGIKPGDVISFCVPTTPETFYSFYALNKIGAIPNMIDPRTNVANIKKFIKDANSKMVFYVDIAAPKLTPILNELNIDKVVSIDATNSAPEKLRKLAAFKNKVTGLFKKKKIIEEKHKSISWNNFIENGRDFIGEIPKVEDKINQVAGIVYTSGTTGVPKGSMMTNKNFLAMVYQNWCANMGWDKNDILLGIMPPFIAYGLVCGFTLPLCNGMQIDIIPKFDKKKFPSYILKHKPNHIMGVPDYMDYLTKSLLLKIIKKLPFIKTAIVGGDRMVISSEENFNKFLVKKETMTNETAKGYGMTEMSSNAVYTINHDANKLGSVGVPLIGNDIKIVDENGNDLSYNEVGEVCLTGPTLINGYFNNEEQTNKSFVIENGKRWIHTKDKGYMDEDGRLYFCDRDKRIIIRSDGHNVWPSNIEKIIERHPGIVKCCVTGVKPNEKENGEIPTAFIVIDKKNLHSVQTIVNEINEACLKELPERDIALQYVIKDDLPLTPVGKIAYTKLSEEGVNDMKQNKVILANGKSKKKKMILAKK